MVVGFIAIGITVFLAILGGIYGYGKFTQKVDDLSLQVGNHITHDIADIKTSLKNGDKRMTAIETDVAFIKGKLSVEDE